MKTLISVIAGAAVAGAGAHASDFNTICARGADERLIEIVSPGEVGQMCDVRYSRDNGANVRTPYHANNSAAFCVEKANELVSELQGAGFNCVAADGTLITGALEAPEEIAPEPASDFVMEATRAPQADARPAAPAPAAAAAPAAEDERALLARMNEILAEPAQEAPAQEAPVQQTPAPQTAAPPPVQSAAASDDPAAASGPTDLTPRADEAPTALAGAAPAPERAPEPVSEPVAAPVTQAAAPVPTPVTPVSTRTPAERAAPAALSRRPEDIIRATIDAQAAAWNEGDLDAFMDIYARDDDLTFISGGDVAARGWSATMRRYRERYSGAGGMGRIGLDGVQTRMVTEDVAIVTGKVRHVIDGQTDSGVFSLVMRRNDGVWRIVHDHTTADAGAAGN